MKRTRLTPVMGLLWTLVFPAMAFAGPTFEVTITNLTGGPGGTFTNSQGSSSGGQNFTPIMVVSHRAGVGLFTLGQPASAALQDLAESGDTSMLTSALQANPNVLDVETGAGLAPGASLTMNVKAMSGFNHLSLAAMLVPTNAGFFALNDVVIPTNGQAVTFYSPGYDAGSKNDDELCANIPGPSNVCQGTGFVTPASGIGFVHIHNGIHGVGDLPANYFDWRNPVAKIVVRLSH